MKYTRKLKEETFPTWEEIEKGYHTYQLRGQYKGLDEYGDPMYSKPYTHYCIIKHNEVLNHFVEIQVIYKHEKPEYMRLMFLHKPWNYDRYNFDIEGYNKMRQTFDKIINFIQKQLDFISMPLENV